MKQERRRNERFNSSTILQYKFGFFSNFGDALTKDVSLGGVCFFSEKKMKTGKIVKLRLYFDNKHPAKVLKGKIVWSRYISDKVSSGYLNGLELVR